MDTSASRKRPAQDHEDDHARKRQKFRALKLDALRIYTKHGENKKGEEVTHFHDTWYNVSGREQMHREELLRGELNSLNYHYGEKVLSMYEVIPPRNHAENLPKHPLDVVTEMLKNSVTLFELTGSDRELAFKYQRKAVFNRLGDYDGPVAAMDIAEAAVLLREDRFAEKKMRQAAAARQAKAKAKAPSTPADQQMRDTNAPGGGMKQPVIASTASAPAHAFARQHTVAAELPIAAGHRAPTPSFTSSAPTHDMGSSSQLQATMPFTQDQMGTAPRPNGLHASPTPAAPGTPAPHHGREPGREPRTYTHTPGRVSKLRLHPAPQRDVNMNDAPQPNSENQLHRPEPRQQPEWRFTMFDRANTTPPSTASVPRPAPASTHASAPSFGFPREAKVMHRRMQGHVFGSLNDPQVDGSVEQNQYHVNFN